MPKKRLCRRLYVTLRVRGEQQHFEELVIRKAFGSTGDHPLAQPPAMPVIMRYSAAFGELVPAMPHSVREISRPALAVSVAVGAVDLEAQALYAVMVACIEDPHAPRGVPYSAEAAGFGREGRMVGTANRNAAVLLFNDRERHHRPDFSIPSR